LIFIKGFFNSLMVIIKEPSKMVANMVMDSILSKTDVNIWDLTSTVRKKAKVSYI